MLTQCIEQVLCSFLFCCIHCASTHSLISLVYFEAVFECSENFSLCEMGYLFLVDFSLHKLKRLMLLALKVVNIVHLSFNSHVHLMNLVFFTARVLIVVALILSHVASSHLRILHH